MFCFYCDAPLHSRDAYQYDHFPIPRAAGGVDVVPACTTCHDIKDCAPLRDNADWFSNEAHKTTRRREVFAWAFTTAAELPRFERPAKLALLQRRLKRLPRGVRLLIAKCIAIEAHAALEQCDGDAS